MRKMRRVTSSLMYGVYVYFLDVDELNFNISVFSFMVVLADDFQNIVVNEVAVAAVDSKATVIRNIFQRVPQLHLVEKGNIRIQPDKIMFPAILLCLIDLVLCLKIILNDEVNRQYQTNANTDQQIRQQDDHYS